MGEGVPAVGMEASADVVWLMGYPLVSADIGGMMFPSTVSMA